MFLQWWNNSCNSDKQTVSSSKASRPEGTESYELQKDEIVLVLIGILQLRYYEIRIDVGALGLANILLVCDSVDEFF